MPRRPQFPHRVALSLSPETYEMLKELSKALDRPVATLIREFLEAGTPKIKSAAKLSAQAKNDFLVGAVGLAFSERVTQ